jgi:hypothetical protein
MKGDFTRSTFDQKKHYSSVRMQQGRVQLDADWNEQVDIQTYLLEQSLEDVVGPCGAPLQHAGFALTIFKGTDNKNILIIGKGHYYVHGTLCENETEYLNQEILKDAESDANLLGVNNFLFYLDVWQKHVTAVEDESIAEIALGGPDTTTRTKTIWQVKCKPISGTLDENPCIQNFDEWDDLIAERDAKLKASVDPETSPTDPCIVPSGAGYRGLENHLYRVEIHKADGEKTTFKWSRDNGSILRAVDEIDGDDHVIKIKNAGQDILHAFEPDQWIEITDDRRELNEEPGTLVYLTEVKDGVELKFDPVVIGDLVNSTNYPEKYNPKVRRWDQTESGEIKIDSEWKELEHGLGVQFEEDGNYKSGDFWLIPARTANGDIEWSKENEGWQQRFGIEHRYCSLAIFNYEDNIWKKIKDCRRLFPNMTEMVTLSYVGGDGQEVMPGKELPAPLQVRVSVGQHPIKDARVQFSITEGKGDLRPDTGPVINKLIVKTGDDGLAEIGLQLDTEYDEDKTIIGVEASLLDAMLLDDEGESLVVHPSIYFQANASIAKKVYYDPILCPDLNEKGINTVQDAIDELCKYKEIEEPGIHIKDIRINRAGTDQPLANDSVISVDDLINGIQVFCDKQIYPETISGKPTCFVTLDMPYPFNSADVDLWGSQVIGFQPLILAADVNSDNNAIYWNPAQNTMSWLKESLLQMMVEFKRGNRILAHLTLKGNFIRAEDDPSLYLDGEAFSVPKGQTETDLNLPSGNNRRGGDFEMWFWLGEEIESEVKFVMYDACMEHDNLIVEHGLNENGAKNADTIGGTTGGKYYAMVGNRVALNGNPKYLTDIIFEDDENDSHTLREGQLIDLTEGLVLTVGKINVNADDKSHVNLSLIMNGLTIDSKNVAENSLYTFILDEIGDETDVPMVVTYVDTIFAGMATNIVKLVNTWAISFNIKISE